MDFLPKKLNKVVCFLAAEAGANGDEAPEEAADCLGGEEAATSVVGVAAAVGGGGVPEATGC